MYLNTYTTFAYVFVFRQMSNISLQSRYWKQFVHSNTTTIFLKIHNETYWKEDPSFCIHRYQTTVLQNYHPVELSIMLQNMKSFSIHDDLLNNIRKSEASLFLYFQNI